MNIDERLESLAQTVERMAQQGNERQQSIDQAFDRSAQAQAGVDQRLQALVQTVELLGHMQVASEERIAKIEVLLGHVTESIDSLARIALA